MPQTKYRIYELSARAVMAYGREQDGVYTFQLDRTATEKCKAASASHEQDGNALFFQTMCELHGNAYQEPDDEQTIPDLADVIFYMNFERVFDRGSSARQLERQKKAEAMFRPEGVTLDFGDGAHRYRAFERSGSMSRNARLSFIRADLYERVRQRIMLDMKIGACQLSKLYAYNGLMLSGGVRVDGIGVDAPHRVIVVDNPEVKEHNVNVITVTDDGSEHIPRKYRREEKRMDVKVIRFDGEGLISKRYAKTVDKAYCGKYIHTSFQIRMPYVKGMLHQVDFHDFFKSTGTETITDIFGVEHRIVDVDIILTRSMFKGYGWLRENDMSWEDYWSAFRKYRHALYITNVSKEKPERTTELNYQFLNTVSIRAEEFRPADLPDGWDHSPEEDSRRWLTKETELAYYNFCASEQHRLAYFTDELSRKDINKKSREYRMAKVLSKNPLFIHEPVFTKELTAKADEVLKQYSIGRLLVEGDNRFLSGDLLEFMVLLLPPHANRNSKENKFYYIAMTNDFQSNSFYAPGSVYEPGDTCTLLRNPHIARNEEIQLSVYSKKDQMRKHYLGHLTDVVMVDANMLAAERLGGADYDGDMIKTITDPILNECVKRNYKLDSLENNFNIPLLMIPSAEPRIRDANDWYACFETVRDTFSSRVGQICNSALDRSIIAYNENSDAEERQRCREETEALAILTGLEIDSAKSGVKPDLTEYLGRRTVKRTPFLQYKKLVEDAEDRKAWYEPTHREKLKAFFEKTDWSAVDSNVERLPYIANKIKKNTPKIKPNPASDGELFRFAVRENWQNTLDMDILLSVRELLQDYEACLSRIRACRAPVKDRQKEMDINRILFARGQEEIYDADELYALFRQLAPERLTVLRQAIQDEKWHLMSMADREAFLQKYLPEPEFMDWHDLLTDFRSSGYRILGDLVCDIDDENTRQERKRLIRETDSEDFASMMTAYIGKAFSDDYKKAVSKKCRELMDRIIKPTAAVPYVVALGKRNLLWDLLIDQLEKHVLEVRYAE